MSDVPYADVPYAVAYASDDPHVLYVSRHGGNIVCPGCHGHAGGEELRVALHHGIWRCGGEVWRVIDQYVIDEQVLA